MKPDGFEVPPIRIPLVPRTQRVPRAGDEPTRRDPQQPGRQRKDGDGTPRLVPNGETTGHGLDLET